MMKLKAKYHGSCKSNYNARSYKRRYDEAQSPIIMLVVIRVNMMKLKAKYHGSCKSNYNARSYKRRYDEAQSQVSWLMQVQL